jgi:hypothetical protein
VDGVRVLPDRRPRLSLWISGRPKSQRTRAPVRYVEALQAEARKQLQSGPFSSSTVDVEIIEGERETDVYLVDANTPETEKPSLVTLVIGQSAAASPAT